MGKSEYARSKGRTPQAFRAWLDRGLISERSLVGDGFHAKVWVERADAELEAALGPRWVEKLGRKLSPTPPQKTEEINQHLVRRRAAEAEKAELITEKLRRELNAQAGRWIDAEATKRVWGQEMARTITEMEVYLGTVLAQDLASDFELDWKEVSTKIRQSFRRYRTQAADRAAQELAILRGGAISQ